MILLYDPIISHIVFITPFNFSTLITSTFFLFTLIFGLYIEYSEQSTGKFNFF